MDRFFFLSGAVAAFIAVALGAFGAHSLKTKLSADMLNIFEIGVRYQMYHALGLIAVAWATTRWPEANLNAAGWAFIVGIVVFSGSLYLLSIDRHPLARRHHADRWPRVPNRLGHPGLVRRPITHRSLISGF